MNKCNLHPDSPRDPVLLRCLACHPELEVRAGFHGELLCPNPLENWKMTRGFESMQEEYDLLHAGEITPQDIQAVVTSAVGVGPLALMTLIVAGLEVALILRLMAR